MQRLGILLMAFFVVSSCKISPDAIEKDFTGSWDVVGEAEVNWDDIVDKRNFAVAKCIDNHLIGFHDMHLSFGNKRIEYYVSQDLYYDNGSYSIDENGIVTVKWDDGASDMYWMHVHREMLYMIEFTLDDSGEMSDLQPAFKFKRVSSSPSWQKQ